VRGFGFVFIRDAMWVGLSLYESSPGRGGNGRLRSIPPSWGTCWPRSTSFESLQLFLCDVSEALLSLRFMDDQWSCVLDRVLILVAMLRRLPADELGRI
jgi:hypothetical protein